MMHSGHIAIASVLVLAAIVVVIGTTVTLSSINSLQGSFSGRKSVQALGLVDACVEDALSRLNDENAIPTTLDFPEGSCTVSVTDSSNGVDWFFTVKGSMDSYNKAVDIHATRKASVNVETWIEVDE